MRRTKIVCTLGPATKDDKILRALIDNGMNVARQNFSHGTHESHKIDHDRVIRIAKEAGKPVATLLDTKGPEVRAAQSPRYSPEAHSSSPPARRKAR